MHLFSSVCLLLISAHSQVRSTQSCYICSLSAHQRLKTESAVCHFCRVTERTTCFQTGFLNTASRLSLVSQTDSPVPHSLVRIWMSVVNLVFCVSRSDIQWCLSLSDPQPFRLQTVGGAGLWWSGLSSPSDSRTPSQRPPLCSSKTSRGSSMPRTVRWPGSPPSC